MLLDIEELNRHGRLGTYDVSKLSFGVLPAIGDGYRMLRSGAALGRGVGPLVVAREQQTLAAGGGRRRSPSRAATRRPSCCCASPRPTLAGVEVLRYDRILDAVATGAVDAGLIIHESRFTYADHGLARVADLGEWWEETTGLPIPLAAICARQRPRRGDSPARWSAAIRASVEYAFAHPEASRAWMREHAQELSDDVCDQHVALYVNEFSIDLGDEGLEAIDRLLQRAPASGRNDREPVGLRRHHVHDDGGLLAGHALGAALDVGGAAPHQHARAGAGQRHAERVDAVGEHATRRANVGTRCARASWCRLVRQGRRQVVDAARVERRDQQRDPLHVVDGVGPQRLLGQRRAGGAGGEPLGRHGEAPARDRGAARSGAPSAGRRRRS